MEYVVMIGQLFLSLSILIVLHEMGHFFPAKWFKTRVEKFYLFFDPWFSLFKYKKGDTEYGVGWLPLGGYVKISGMIDESLDTEALKEPPKPWEFRSKPAWQRLIIMLGGVTVNFVLGFLLMGLVIFKWGDEYIPTQNVVDGIYVDSLGYEIGLRDGDKIISVGDHQFDKFQYGEALRQIIINNADNIVVNRNGQNKKVNIDPKYVSILASSSRKNRIFGERVPFIIDGLSDEPDYPGKKAGIQINDKIVALNGQSTPFYNDFNKVVKNLKGQTVDLKVMRTDTLSGVISPKNIKLTLTDEGKIGVSARHPFLILGTQVQNYNLGQALPLGLSRGWSFLGDQMKGFAQMFRGKIDPRESMGGFGTIGKMFGSTWDWQHFWRMTAILSLILAFMNLLPIPALDGGHVMFLLYEMVTGRRPSDKFMEYATIAGFVIVIALVLFANGMDFLRWFRGE